MSRSRGEHGGGPERLIVADASGGQFAIPTFAHRFAVVGKLDEDGAPVIRKEDEILLDWKQVRVHDLQQDAKPGVRDRRLQFQIVNNYEDSVEPPKDGMSPYAQAEYWTALNRSTREADGFGRVALPGSHRRIVGSEDGKYAIATTLVEWQESASVEVGNGADRPPPEGVAFKEPGIETGSGGSVARSSPSVSVNGVTVFGEAAVTAARDAVNAGASPAEILSAAQSGKYTPPTQTRDPAEPEEPEAPPVPSTRPGGYVANEAKKTGLLGTFFTPALGEAIFAGREGEEIGALVARADAQFAASKEKRGRLHLKTDDVASIPEDTKSQRVKGWLMFDSSVKEQDSKIPGDLGQWRPVVPVNAKIPPSGDPPPPPPPKKPKPIGVIPGYLAGPGGGNGSKGKAELYPGWSSGETTPTPPKQPETGDGLAGGDLTPVGVLTGAGGASSAPEGAVIAGGTGTSGVRTGANGEGEGPTAVATGPVTNPQSQKRDLTGQFVDPVPCPLATSGGAVIAGGTGTSSAPEGSTQTGDGPQAPLGPPGAAIDDPPGGFQPDPSPLPETFYEPGFPALQVVGNEVWLGGSRSGNGPSGHPVEVKGAPATAEVAFGSHNVLTTPIPVMGQPGGPTNVEDELAWIAYAAESLRQVVMGMVGGPAFLASNIAVVHQNTPGNPPAGSTIGAQWTARPGEILRTDESPFRVPGTLHADAGAQLVATGAGIFEVVREHTGDGSVVDKRPAILVDNRTKGEIVSTADAFSTHDRRAAITGGAQVLSAGLVAHRTPEETRDPFEVATVTKADAGRNPGPGSKDFIAWIPLSSQVLAATRGFMATKLYDGGQGGGLLMVPSDETTYIDGIPSRNRGGQILIAEDPNGLGTVGGFSLTRRGTSTTVLSMTDSEVGNSRSRIEVDVLDPEAVIMVPLATRPAEFVDIPDNKPGLWVDEADDDNRPVWWTGDCTNGAVDRPLAFLDEMGNSGLPTRYVSGLVIRYASSSTVTVSAGKARDKADGADMTLASQVTVNLTSVGALGVERKALTGTASFTNASGTVTGSGTAFLSEFGTRAATGTVSTSGGTTWTGTGTKFLTEVAVNDLVGNSSRGFFRVSVISSDTSLQTDTNPGGVTSDFSNDAFSVTENPKIETAGGRTYVVERITSNTALTLLSSTAATATETGVAAYAGGKKCTTGNVSDGWRAVWLLSGGSGTTVAFSTQRTTPYGSITGYTTSYRRIGWVRINSSGNILASYGSEGGPGRWTAYEADGTIAEMRALSNASSTTSWQSFSCSSAIPPTARTIRGWLFSLSPNTASVVYVRGRNLGDSAVARNLFVQAVSTSTTGFAAVVVPCDGVQYLDHGAAGSATGDGTFFDLLGYEDTLE